VTYNGVPILDVKHPALVSRSGVCGGAAWRDAQAAHTILGVDYDTFRALPREQRITVIAQYEIMWRVEALVAWEREQERRAHSKNASKGRRVKV